MLYLIMDPVDNCIRWVNAGHLPPLLVVGDGLAHFLEGASSVPLGVMPFPTFDEQSVEVEQGGTVVLYTDGLVERPGEVIDDGLAALATAVRGGPTDDTEVLCDRLLRTLVPEGGASDDVALLALRNTPVSESFDVALPAAPESLASMRALLRRWLRHAEGSEQEIAEITTACSEAATNAIEHAGSSDDEPFEVTGRIRKHEVDITVRDFGAWRTPRGGDQGRGLSLMRALMDSVDVTPTPVGTTVRLERALRGNGGPG
jgi:anti-sigma regulatory factor (Ser/Thr protein kinase)